MRGKLMTQDGKGGFLVCEVDVSVIPQIFEYTTWQLEQKVFHELHRPEVNLKLQGGPQYIEGDHRVTIFTMEDEFLISGLFRAHMGNLYAIGKVIF